MNLHIIPFENNMFNLVGKTKLTSDTYITNLSVISKLLAMDLPIKNQRIAIRTILDFLAFIDNMVGYVDGTLLPISSDILIEHLTRTHYKKYLKIFEDLEIMTKVPYKDGQFYVIGKKPSQFRIHSNYLKDTELAIVVIEDNKNISFTNEVDGLDKRYVNTIKKLELNIEAAITAEVEHYTAGNIQIEALRSRITRLLYTKRKRFIKKGKKVERVYHSFTNLSRISRKHFNIPMYDIDVVNCQPLLLVALLLNNGYIIDDNYKMDCECGCFYERFLPESHSDDERQDIKRSIYRNIFFGFYETNKTNKLFKELYPKTWTAIKNINDTNKNGMSHSLAAQLQNIESKLFNSVKPKLSKYYFTLFDAVYFDNLYDRFQLEKEIKRYFMNYNVQVQIK